MTSDVRRMLQAAIVYLGIVVAGLDSALNAIFPELTHAFGRGQESIQWVIIPLILTYGALLPLFGTLGDVMGWRLRAFQVGLLLNGLAFIGLALAPNFETLVALRVVQGVATAAVFSCAPALVTALYDVAMRPTISGRVAAALALGSILGVLLGILALAAFDWNAVFWLRSPLCFVLFGCSFFLPANEIRETRKLDVGGAVAFLVAISLCIGAIEALSVDQRWAIAAAMACVIATVLFIRRENRFPDPMIPLKQFSPELLIWIFVGTGVFFISFAPLLLIPYLDAFPLIIMPWILVAGVSGIPVGALILPRLFPNPHRQTVGLAGLLVLFAGTYLAAVSNHAAWMAAALFIQGLGIGVFSFAYTDLLLDTMEERDRGVAGSLVGLTRTLGFAFCASVLTIVNHTQKAATITDGLPLPVMRAFQNTFVLTAGIGALILIPIFLWGWIRGHRKNQRSMSGSP